MSLCLCVFVAQKNVKQFKSWPRLSSINEALGRLGGSESQLLTRMVGEYWHLHTLLLVPGASKSCGRIEGGRVRKV